MVQSLHLANKGDDSKALETAQQILAIAREIGDVVQEASALFVVGQVHAAKVGREKKPGQDYSEAISQCTEAVEILEDVGNKRGQLPILEFIYSMQRGQHQEMEAMSTARD